MDMLEPSTPLDDAQHETFAQLMAEGTASQGQCYATAYARDEVDDTAYSNASRLLRNAKVTARITYLKEQAAKVAVVDAGKVIAGLQENISAAQKGNPVFNRHGEITGYRRDFAAVNRGYELLGKAVNLFKDGLVLEDNRDPIDVEAWRKRDVEEIRLKRDRLLREN